MSSEKYFGVGFVDTDKLDKVIEKLKLTPQQVDKAIISCLSPSVRWIKQQLVRRISRAKRLEPALVANEIRIERTRVGSSLFVVRGFDLLPLRRLGEGVQTPLGLKIRNVLYPHTFKIPRWQYSKKKLGYVSKEDYIGVFERTSKRRLPIFEHTFEFGDAIAKNIDKMLENDEIGEVFEKHFYKKVDQIMGSL